jgi:plastocyanin
VHEHTTWSDDLDLSTGTLDPGEVVTATFTVPTSAVTFYCSFHPGMDGELRPAAG